MPTAASFSDTDKSTYVQVFGTYDMSMWNFNAGSGRGRCARSTAATEGSKYYIEFDIHNTGGMDHPGESACGFCMYDKSLEYAMGYGGNGGSVGFYIDPDVGSYGAVRMQWESGHSTILENTSAPAWGEDSVIMLAIDQIAGKIWVGVDGTWSGDPAAGTGEALSELPRPYPEIYFGASSYESVQITVRSQPSDQTYTAPSGFNALWAEQVAGTITAGLGASESPELVREIEASITAGLGAWMNGQDGENAYMTEALGVSGVSTSFRDRSPIDGDIELDAVFDMYRWHGGYLAADPNVGLGCTVQTELQYELESISEGAGFGVGLQCFNFSELLRENAGNIIRQFEFILTGDGESPAVEDVVIPMSSLQARMRQSVPSYVSLQVPTLEYTDEIVARPNGTIKVYMLAQVAGSEAIRELIISAALDDVRTDKGPLSRTLTLTGYQTETWGSQTVTLTGVTQIAETDGKFTVTADIDFYLKPGYTVKADGEEFVAGLVSYSATTRRQTMKVTEA